jgi:hypothetical protein
MVYRSRLEETPERFMQVREVAGPPNAETRLALLETRGAWARYALTPVTGRKHQLRAHCAALGEPQAGASSSALNPSRVANRRRTSSSASPDAAARTEPAAERSAESTSGAKTSRGSPAIDGQDAVCSDMVSA